jgi:hypothetical protein
MDHFSAISWQEQAQAIIDTQSVETDKFALSLFDVSWHEGIVGIVKIVAYAWFYLITLKVFQRRMDGTVDFYRK